MNKRKLQLQADRIEMVLERHKAPGHVTGGRVTPRTIQFHIQPALSTKLARLNGLGEEIALALGASSARISRSDGHINVEIPRPDTYSSGFLEMCDGLSDEPQLLRAVRVPGTALLGTDSEGVPLLVRLASPDVTHMLIAGTTGSGKSEALKTIIASLVYFQKPSEIQLILVDPKRRILQPFDGLPHVLSDAAKTVDEALSRMHWLLAEMERRQAEDIASPRLVLGVDELGDLMSEGGREMQAVLSRLVQRGRSAGISIIACTQKPTSAAIGSLVKGNFPVRLVGKVTSAEDARVASGIGGTGAEKLSGRGDFLLVAGGQVIRFQVARLADTDYPQFRSRLVRRLNSGAPSPGSRGMIARLVRRN